ncbi:hypothetical protein YPPY103_2406, partial [Yersinia pestis PY-103]
MLYTADIFAECSISVIIT